MGGHSLYIKEHDSIATSFFLEKVYVYIRSLHPPHQCKEEEKLWYKEEKTQLLQKERKKMKLKKCRVQETRGKTLIAEMLAFFQTCKFIFPHMRPVPREKQKRKNQRKRKKKRSG